MPVNVVEGSKIEIAYADIIEYKEGDEVISIESSPPPVIVENEQAEITPNEVNLETKDDKRTIKQKKKAANKKLALASTLAFVLFLAGLALGLLFAVLAIQFVWNSATGSSSPDVGKKVQNIGIAAAVLLILAIAIFLLGLGIAASTTLS